MTICMGLKSLIISFSVAVSRGNDGGLSYICKPIEGQESEPLILCPLHISFNPGRIFIKLQSNVHLSENVRET